MMIRQLLFLLVWLVLLIAGIVYLLGKVSITNDLTQFLPQGASQQQKLAITLARTGPASRLIIIALENAPAGDLANTSRRMVSLLDKDGRFSHVSNGIEIDPSKLDLMFRYRYLLDPDTNATSFSKQSLKRALQQRLEELSGAFMIADTEYLQADPTDSFRKVIATWQAGLRPHMLNGVWFTPDGRRALLVATTRGSGFDPQIQEQALDAIHTAFAESVTAKDTRLLLSGTPVFAHNTRDTIRSDLKFLSITACILVALFLLVAYRSPYLLVLGGIPIVTGLFAGCVITSILFGGIHGITLVFGITLLGVAIDYPIHLFSHLTDAKTPRQSILHIWPTLRLGVITTCIGYIAFVRQDFNGLAQLGIFTITGLLTAAAITRWFLPALIISDKLRKPRPELTARLDSIIHLPRYAARLVLVIAGISLVLLLLISPPMWETDLSELSPITTKERLLSNDLRSAIGAPDPAQLIVVNGTDSETVLMTCEEITGKLQHAVDLGLISGFDAPTRYLPSMETQKSRQAAIPDSMTTRQILTSALQGLPFKQDAFNPFIDALSESKRLPPLALSDVEKTLLGPKIQSLLMNEKQEWKALILLSGISSKHDFQDWWSHQKITDAYLLDLKAMSTNLLADFRNSTLERISAGVVLILVLLSIGLRSPGKALLILLPVFLAVSLDAALLGLIGEQLSLFHLIAMLLTVGIGIDYSLFFHRSKTQYKDRPNITHSLFICAVSTVTVFGILATSPIPVLHAIGLTVSIGIVLCFFLASATINAGMPTD